MNAEQATHYQHGEIQPIEFIRANEFNFCEGNVIKYVSRYRHKNGLEDLLKARQYLDWLIEDQQKREDLEMVSPGA